MIAGAPIRRWTSSAPASRTSSTSWVEVVPRTNDRVVDNRDRFAFHRRSDRIELQPDRALALVLRRHDERPADVAVLHQAPRRTRCRRRRPPAAPRPRSSRRRRRRSRRRTLVRSPEPASPRRTRRRTPPRASGRAHGAPRTRGSRRSRSRGARSRRVRKAVGGRLALDQLIRVVTGPVGLQNDKFAGAHVADQLPVEGVDGG